MHVGTRSGVRSPGMVISSALGGTSRGNSSLTKDKISEVLPTFLVAIKNNKFQATHLNSQNDLALFVPISDSWAVPISNINHATLCLRLGHLSVPILALSEIGTFRFQTFTVLAYKLP